MQCIAWDGRTLSALKGKWVNHIYFEGQPCPRVSPTVSPHLGEIRAMILSVPVEFSQQVLDFFETRTLEEFINFYRQVCKQGLLGRAFQFQLMAVVDGFVIGMSVNNLRMQLRAVLRGDVLAIGVEAVGAMAMMAAMEVPSQHAVAAIAIADDEAASEQLWCSDTLVYDLDGAETWSYVESRHVSLGLPFRRAGNIPDVLKEHHVCDPACAAIGLTTKSGPGSVTTAHTC